ncbi:MAG: GH3 auxin-responsive promoter, partial [Crinalium sp.]
SHHYKLARLLGQLDPPQVLISSQIPEIITNYKMRQGMKWGDIKHQLLVTTPIEQELLNLLSMST